MKVSKYWEERIELSRARMDGFKKGIILGLTVGFIATCVLIAVLHG